MRGPALAPPLIREALHSSAGHLWTEALQDLGASGGLQDAGDLAIPDGPQGRELIESAIAIVLRKGWSPIALGGDHSVTYPVMRAVHAALGPVTILHFDAHPDLYDEFEGDRYSHACPFARIMEEGLASRLVQVGIRTMNGHLHKLALTFGVEVIDMHAWTRGERPVVDGPVYLSLDLDVLDPAFAPGLSHREPGGLSVRDVISVIQTMRGTLIGADVVECNPVQDPSGLTTTVAAKFVKEIAGRMLHATTA